VQDDGLVGWASCSGSVSSENKSTKVPCSGLGAKDRVLKVQIIRPGAILSTD
jgi:hypothetical protein